MKIIKKIISEAKTVLEEMLMELSYAYPELVRLRLEHKTVIR